MLNEERLLPENRIFYNYQVRVPCAVAHFPKEAPFPPRAWIERGYNIQRWTEMPRGGHFAAAEEPELLANDIAAFFGSLHKTA
jgi:pimeloyl-ACP methyl ester carboxylesterase